MLQEDIFDDAGDKALALRNRVKYAANSKKRAKWKKAYKNLKVYKKRYKYFVSKDSEVEKAIQSAKNSFPKFVKETKKKLDRANSSAYRQLANSKRRGEGPLTQIELKKNPDMTISVNIPNAFKLNQMAESGYPYKRVAELLPYFDNDDIYKDISIAIIEEVDEDTIRIKRKIDDKVIYEGIAKGAINALEEDVKSNTTKYYADFMDFDTLTNLYTTELTIFVTQLENKLKELLGGIRKQGMTIKESLILGEGIIKSQYSTILKATPSQKRGRLEDLRKESRVDPIVVTEDGSEEYAVLYPIGGSEFIGIKGIMDGTEFMPYAKTYLYRLDDINAIPDKSNQKGVWDTFDKEAISDYIKGVRKRQLDTDKKDRAPTPMQRAMSLLGKTKKVVGKGIEFGKRGFTQKAFLFRLSSIDSEMVEEVARILSKYEEMYASIVKITRSQIDFNRSILRNP